MELKIILVITKRQLERTGKENFEEYQFSNMLGGTLQKVNLDPLNIYNTDETYQCRKRFSRNSYLLNVY